MSTQKSLLVTIIEAVEQHRAERRQGRPAEAARTPGRWARLARWFLPNGGTLLLVAALILTQRVWASPALAPAAADSSATTVNYQGRLADSSGNPVNNTNLGVGMTFALYTQESGGSAIWSEPHNVPVSNGLFNVRLGSINSLSAAMLTGDRWLGIKVGTDPEMTPREKLAAVPYAMQAGLALTVPDGAVGRAKLGSDVKLTLVQSGRVSADASSSPGWNLHQGSGERTFVVNVPFGSSFASVPTVQVTLSGFDFIEDGSNQRLVVYASDVTPSGFKLAFRTWSDTKLFAGTATWVAYGPQ